MKKILIPTDFSAHSRHSLEVILKDLNETQEEYQILLLNTYLVKDKNTDDLISLNDELKLQSKQGLEKEKAHAETLILNNNIKITTASHIGTLTNVVQTLIKKENIDLVVMGKDSGKNIQAVKYMLLAQNLCPILITEL